MKQTGKTWVNAEGQHIPVAYLPASVKSAEKYGQQIAAKATAMADAIKTLKHQLVEMAERVMADLPADQREVNRYTFYTFDKEFKFEYEIAASYVRVYKAICKNPTAKDYELIELNANTAFRVSRVEQVEPLPDFEFPSATEAGQSFKISNEIFEAITEQHAAFDGSGSKPLIHDEVGQLPPVVDKA